MSRLPEILTEDVEIRRAVRAITSAIKGDDANVRGSVIGNIRQFPSEWQKLLGESLKELADENNPAVILADGSPFLSAPAVTDNDIPF